MLELHLELVLHLQLPLYHILLLDNLRVHLHISDRLIPELLAMNNLPHRSQIHILHPPKYLLTLKAIRTAPLTLILNMKRPRPHLPHPSILILPLYFRLTLQHPSRIIQFYLHRVRLLRQNQRMENSVILAEPLTIHHLNRSQLLHPHRVPQLHLAALPYQPPLVGAQLAQGVLAVEPTLRPVTQHIDQQVTVEGLQLARQRHPLSLQHLQVHLHRHTVVTRTADQHLVQHHAHRPNIAFLRIPVMSVGLRRHVLRRPDVVKHLRTVWHLRHLAVPEVDYRHSLTLVGMSLKQHIVRLEVPVHYPSVLDATVPLQNLPENTHRLLFWQSLRMPLDVVRQGTALQQLHYQINEVIHNHYLQQSHYVLMCSVLELTQIVQRSYLTTQQVPSDLVIDMGQIYALDCHPTVRVTLLASEVDVSRTALTEKTVIKYCVDLIKSPGLLLHDRHYIMQITDLETLIFIFCISTLLHRPLLILQNQAICFNIIHSKHHTYLFINKTVQNMSALDLSTHPLNISTSKQKYSFPRNQRFLQRHTKPICDTFYDIPTTKSRRTTTLGLGQKNFGLSTKNSTPGAGTYLLDEPLNTSTHKYNVPSFGFGREETQILGPMGHIKLLSKLPGPGTYNGSLSRDTRAPSFNLRLPDHNAQKNIKNPGPGTYNHDNIGSHSYYITSKYRNFTNGKISQVPRIDSIAKRRPSLGPAQYNPVDSMNQVGRYNQSKHSSVSSCVFPRSSRPGLAIKHAALVPGPGQYASFSSFS